MEKEKLQSIMAFGKGTKMDSAFILMKSSVKRKSKEYTVEELVDSGNNFILQLFNAQILTLIIIYVMVKIK